MPQDKGVEAYLDRLRAKGAYGPCQHCEKERPYAPGLLENGVKVCVTCADKATEIVAAEKAQQRQSFLRGFYRALTEGRPGRWFQGKYGQLIHEPATEGE